MHDQSRTNQELLAGNHVLKQQTRELEQPDSETKRMEKSMEKLVRLIAGGEDRLMQILHAYSIGRGYSKYTSTLEEAWRMSISVLSATMITACDSLEGAPELGPDMDCRIDPIAQFGIFEAQKHRERGISIDMFLGLLKYYRQSYVDLIQEADFEREYEDKCRLFVDRVYDRIELGLCKEWLSSDNNKLMEDLQAKSRIMTNEKNKYLTVYESLPHPVIFINNDIEIENMNHSAIQFIQGSNVPGSHYYAVPPDRNNPESSIEGHKLRELFPWLVDDLKRFAHGSDQTIRFEKRVNGGKILQHFDIAIARMLDVSRKFAGMVVVLTNITDRKRSDELLQELVKELNCLYAISTLLELQGTSLDEILKRTVMLIPLAWQFPEIAEASIALKGNTFQTAHFRETSWMQASEVIVNGNPVGHVEVCYLEERQASDEGPFLKEERKLLNAIAVTLGRIAERKLAEEALEEERRRLQQALDEIRTLRGIVPICSYCKKIRDDEGYWSQVEQYVSKHTDAKFSHGICPSCFEREMKGIKGETRAKQYDS